MSTYQMVVRSTASIFNGVSLAAMYERFLDWWASLYIEDRRNPPPYL
jgi:hypothetical protein